MRNVQPTTPRSSWILLVLLLHRYRTTLRSASEERINKLETHPNARLLRGGIDGRMNLFPETRRLFRFSLF